MLSSAAVAPRAGGQSDRRQRRTTGEGEMLFRRRGFLSLPMVIGAVVIGVVSGRAIFGPPLEEYWTRKLHEEEAVKEVPANKDLTASEQA